MYVPKIVVRNILLLTRLLLLGSSLWHSTSRSNILMPHILTIQVVTVIGGLCKLKYSHWKIRKYNKVTATEATQTPEVLEAQQPPEGVQEEKDEIPFGIRAIESGIEVDGVWISRSNTPVPSSASSICNEPRNRQNGTSPSCDGIELELPQPVHGSSSRASSRAPSSSFDRAVSAEQLPDSRPSSPRPSTSTRGRQAMQTSQSRYSNPNLLRHSSTLNALEGLDPGASYGKPFPFPRLYLLWGKRTDKIRSNW